MKLLGRRILMITAHPDDESYCAAGTIFLHSQAGSAVTLLCATLGEKGTSHLKRATTPAAMKARRKKELSAAARVLGIKRVITLAYPDGGVDRHTAALARRAKVLARSLRADAIVSFGPDGLTAHRDHIAAGQAAKHAAKTLGLPFFAFSLPKAMQRDANLWLKTRRTAGHYQNGVTFLTPTVRYRINASIKRKALSCHRSQMDGPRILSGYPAYAVKALLTTEYFVGPKGWSGILSQ
jgi:LmbE family N-acetylglucosaminyl deacetylase